jgi:hypothetical protein
MALIAGWIRRRTVETANMVSVNLGRGRKRWLINTADFSCQLVKGLVLGQENPASEGFQQMRALQSVHDGALDLGQVKLDARIDHAMVDGFQTFQRRGVDPVHG